ncbi:YbjN domain-containing protein [Cellulomonas sp. IC4_254]|uniref:YbjN domain-containing protein n=1 Tax=Cellulomonas sp. IC4_254 TaxID=2714040 RepID=UPI003217AD36
MPATSTDVARGTHVAPHDTHEDAMGFFTKPDAAASVPGPQPLSHQRIIDVLDAREMNYGVDDDGDIGGYWDGHLFYFFRLGGQQEYLQTRGRWNRRVGIDQYARVVDLVNTWNSEKLWPKGYVRAEDDVVGVYAEHTVDYEHGATDEQIDLHLACGITTALSLFEHLDEQFPAEAAAAKAAEAAASGE